MSHSKHDSDIVNYFSKAFGRVGLSLQLMELENLTNKYAGFEISNIITNESGGVAVLLGKNLQSPPTMSPEFTHNWVNFEVGVAAGTGKRVWVFEEYGPNIRFPIPYVTDYVRYILDNDEHLRIIGEILKANLTARMSNQPSIKCPHSSCNAVYYYWSTATQIHCPVCRHPIPKYEERRERLNLSNVR
jgi:hypothetical protein